MARILIVDDHPDSCEVLALMLRHGSHDVKCVTNGREALMSILTDMPDLVLLDLLMPEMGGVDLLEVLRSYLRLQRLPVVVITGFPEGPSVDRARSLGVKHIMTKGSYTAEELLGAAKAALASY